MGAQEIFETLSRTMDINRVTVYRILDLLTEKGLVIRLSGLGRGLVYGLAPNENHPPHPHFQCRSCGALQCMQPVSLNMDLREVQRTFPGEITGVDIRVSGTCGSCLKTERNRVKRGQKSLRMNHLSCGITTNLFPKRLARFCSMIDVNIKSICRLMSLCQRRICPCQSNKGFVG